MLWSRSVHAARASSSQVLSLDVDADANVYVLVELIGPVAWGDGQNSDAGQHLFLVSYAADGALR
jgi:hypothetical protein